MLWALIKKDLLHMQKEKSVLILLFIMPLGLISILGFAQSGGNEMGSFSIAVINAETQEEEVNYFLQEAEAQGIPREAAEELVNQFNVKDIIIDEVFAADIGERIQIETGITRDEALENEEFAAVIEFPEGYQQSVWSSIMLNQDNEEELLLYLNEEQSTNALIIDSMIHSFYETLRMQSIASDMDLPQPAFIEPVDYDIIQTQEHPIDIFHYVTVGMASMFVLYTAGLVARYATDEKRTRVFNRMILTRAPGYLYVTSKWITGTIVAAFQLSVIFLISYFAFNVTWGSLLQFILVTLTISLVVGGLTVLLTSINFRLDSYKASTIFSNIFVTLLAFVGGSFVQTDMLSPIIGLFGRYTPNGVTMTAYFQAFQGGELTSILPNLLILLSYSVILVGIAILYFPKRGGHQ
ncbi:ABC transporter permease [Alkalicoccobacillus porphyridii]|uniref:ABC transporter permease n=1 Tax=Alkalicoccobacillus porphyridii TaxID=2597270 RepID=A0A553ZV08_9BACI|nr:ABC transporter permease [Alkalicoccobacillus porphyridii]TSB45253.1 ABC transporter permease [Alkalicoccobacillus porphyridii]